MLQQTPTPAPSKVTCALCAKTRKADGNATICQHCHQRLRSTIQQIPALWVEAHNCLQPYKGGHGSNTGEPTLGVNLTALDFISGRDILDLFHGWERIVREDRKLTPPALVPAQPTKGHEIAATVAFHLTHLDWIAQQAWVDEYAKEMLALYGKGRAAAQKFLDPVRRISCPAPAGEATCGQTLSINDSDMLAIVPCRRCGTEWTVGRLIAVGTSEGTATWVDADSIGTWLGISAGHVRRLVRKHHVERKGNLYNMQQVVAAHKGVK